jgi:NAD-dependent dihydropyrimidine dehydrogenase PreA subunit/nitroreductase
VVIVDRDKCVGCGLCAEICHEHCIALVEGVASIDRALCSSCTQCIAVCPQQALSWDRVPPLAYDRARLPSPEQLDELFGERRTIRKFKRDKIDRALLQEIVRCGAYAPVHAFGFRAIVVNDEEIIELLDQVIMRFNRRLYDLIFRPRFFHGVVKTLTPGREAEYLKVKPKLESALAQGRAYPSPPVALILVVADRRVALSYPSAQYVLYTMNLCAQVRGIGCRNLVGNQMIANRSRAFRARLGLGKHERIYATMGLGYPDVRFRNKVQGKRMDIQWNDG